MAKLIVAIDIHNMTYENLKREVIDDPKKGIRNDCWFSKEDGDLIIVDDGYLRHAQCEDSFYAFELIDVIP
uniref:Uncharacterized protein n=1 Tax=viral metagenome TaxID=1070528 RepID=A0A6M3ITW7_9ZZZZ